MLLVLYFACLILTYILRIPVPDFIVLFFNSFFLIYYFYINSIRFNQEYRELADLKGKLEQKVKDRTEQLIELHNKKQQFFINFAHETKTPLSLISIYLEKYIKGVKSNKDLEIIKSNIIKLQRDMVNFLDLEKLEKGQYHYNHNRITDLSKITSDKILLFKELANKKQITLNTNIDNGIYIKADPFAIDRIINNLIDNAIKYTEAGGVIKVGLTGKNGVVNLIISDNGIGISPEQQKHIFDAYYQISHSKRNIQGMGMGLNIVQRIVRDLDGEISLNSSLHEGTEIKITLGRCASESIDQSGYAHVSQPFMSGQNYNHNTKALEEYQNNVAEFESAKSTLLIVEDNTELLYFLKSSLSEKYNVLCATNGIEALKLLKDSPKPDIIISDIMMDEMDGYSLFKALNQDYKFRDIPFLFLTALTAKMDKLKALSQGAIDFIVKPLFSIEELENKIESILRFIKIKMQSIKLGMIDKVIDLMDEEKKSPELRKELALKKMQTYEFTQREVEITQLLMEGYQNKEIGAKIFISTRTVDNHIYNIFKKAGCQNRVELLNKLLLE